MMEFKDIKSGLSVTVTERSGNTWTGILLHKLDRSNTKVIILDDQRGPGWNEIKQKYTGYVVKHGTGEILIGRQTAIGGSMTWMRGENHGYGQEHLLHIQQLTINQSINY